LLLPAAPQYHFRATDQRARINAQGPSDQSENYNRADPNPTSATGYAAAILNPCALR
jgi:hypothetical protein